jgi:hypothetical protein
MQLRLTPSAFAGVQVFWNDRRVAAAALRPRVPIMLAFTLDDADVERGVNILDLRHDGVADGQEAALYETLQMVSQPDGP